MMMMNSAAADVLEKVEYYNVITAVGPFFFQLLLLLIKDMYCF